VQLFLWRRKTKFGKFLGTKIYLTLLSIFIFLGCLIWTNSMVDPPVFGKF